MIRKKIPLTIVFTALGGVIIWWFIWQTAPGPKKIAELTTPTKTAAAKQVESSIIAPPIVSSSPQPIAAPAASSHSVATSPTEIGADSQTDLKTAFADMARLVRAGDMMTLVQTYTPPDKLTPLLIQQAQTIEGMAQAQMAALPPDLPPEVQEKIAHPFERLARIFDSLNDQTPTFNASGDEATYLIARSAPPNSSSGASPAPKPLVMVKINGRWYMKDGVEN